MRALVLCLCLFPALAGCAKFLEKFGRANDGFTEVKFGSPAGNRSLLATLNGQLMIYAVSADGAGPTRTFHFNDESAAGAAAVSIRNGEYRFYALGFSGSGMQTDVRCGKASAGQAIRLAGGSTSIQLDLSKAGCAEAAFSPSASAVNLSTGYDEVQFLSCVSSLDLSGLSFSSLCSAGNQGDINHLGSMKVELAGYETAASAPSGSQAVRPGIDTGCHRGDGKPAGVAAFTTAATSSGGPFINENGIFFAMSNGIDRSTNGGSSFSNVLSGVNVQRIHGSGSNLVAGTSGAGIYYSTNGGISWTQSALNSGNFWALYVVSATELYAGSSTGTVYKSVDAGANWTSLGQPFGGGSAIESLIYDSATASIYIGGYASGPVAKLSQSVDGGTTFNPLWTSAGAQDVQVVRKIGNYLYWGTYASGLFRSANADASSPTQYCNSGCANAFLPQNSVTDIALGGSNLFVATINGIGVSLGNDPNTSSSWENYLTTQLGSSYLYATSIAWADGKLFYGASGAPSDAARVMNGRGSGIAFPASGAPLLPAGGSASLPLATRITVYSDQSCQTLRRSYFFPLGIAGPEESSTAYSAFRSDAGTISKLFLRDF